MYILLQKGFNQSGQNTIFAPMINKEQIAADYQEIQEEICASLAATDGLAVFEEERWEREGGGGGRTRIMQNGNIFEKGGVNFSAVHGQLPQTMKKALKVEEEDFFATGISIVIHPNHPLVPIIHMNIRYFEMPSSLNSAAEPVRWFGGGIDLTPHYVAEEDARFFHQQLKAVCDKFNADFYTRFKNWADDYFFIKHRNETRGIGGIFYDRLTAGNDLSWDNIFDFSKALGRSFIPIYTELVNRNRGRQFTPAQQQWQYQRRSRYTEFNLVYDAGTRFGLETNGRVESILMSLPPTAKWLYNYQPEPGSEEEKTLSLLKKGSTGFNMKKILTVLACFIIFTSLTFKQSLKGHWEYGGGIYNGKPSSASKDYTLERIYDDSRYQALFIEPGEKPVNYEKGDYELKADTCLETQTYSKMPSKTTGVQLHYHYQIKNDTLIFTGMLPNGIAVQEYWKKMK